MEGDGLADAYAATVIEVTWPDGGELTGDRVPLVVGPSDPSSGGRLPPGVTTIHVVTAANPWSQTLDDERNAARNRHLAADLDARGWHRVPAVGRSPDGAWREPGFAVADAPDAEVLAIGAAHEQHAVFRWDLDGVHILWCPPPP